MKFMNNVTGKYLQNNIFLKRTFKKRENSTCVIQWLKIKNNNQQKPSLSRPSKCRYTFSIIEHAKAVLMGIPMFVNDKTSCVSYIYF